MRVQELTNFKKQVGVIFEISSLTTTKVARYSKPYGEYIEDKILRESIKLMDYISPEERERNYIPAYRTLVRRAALEICPGEKIVYFEKMAP